MEVGGIAVDVEGIIVEVGGITVEVGGITVEDGCMADIAISIRLCFPSKIPLLVCFGRPPLASLLV